MFISLLDINCYIINTSSCATNIVRFINQRRYDRQSMILWANVTKSQQVMEHLLERRLVIVVDRIVVSQLQVSLCILGADILVLDGKILIGDHKYYFALKSKIASQLLADQEVFLLKNVPEESNQQKPKERFDLDKSIS